MKIDPAPLDFIGLMDDVMMRFAAAAVRSQHLVAAAHERIASLKVQLDLARRNVAESRALLARATVASIVPFHGVLPSASEPAPSVPDADGGSRTFAAVTELIAQVEHAARNDDVQTSRLVEEILRAKQAADPCLLLGILLEGVVHTVLDRIPAAGWQDTAMALCGLLLDRINQAEAGLG
jgi:hypothetical protein